MASRIYISGPMGGYEYYNLPKFFKVADEMREAGYRVENPGDNDSKMLSKAIEKSTLSTKTWEAYLRTDLRRLTKCDAVVVLPGWKASRGASLEVQVARELSIPVYRWNGLVLCPVYDIIGLSGYARSGKDTAAEIMADFGFQRAAFADHIRDALYRTNPHISANCRVSTMVDAFGWDKAKTRFPEIRRLLQVLGTEVGRSIVGPDVWIDSLFKGFDDGGQYVISDVRFPNEYDAIKQWGGEVWRIERPATVAVNSHPSEAALDGYHFDRVIHNDGHIDDLRRKIILKDPL